MVGSHESAFLPLCKAHISGFLGKHVCRSFSHTSMGGLRESALLPFWVNHIQSRFRAPVVQRLDNAIHRVNPYPVDSVVYFVNTYPLDSDLSSG